MFSSKNHRAMDSESKQGEQEGLFSRLKKYASYFFSSNTLPEENDSTISGEDEHYDIIENNSRSISSHHVVTINSERPIEETKEIERPDDQLVLTLAEHQEHSPAEAMDAPQEISLLSKGFRLVKNFLRKSIDLAVFAIQTLLDILRCLLAALKVFAASGQSFFGTEATFSWILENDSLLDLPKLTIAIAVTINSFLFILATRVKEMIKKPSVANSEAKQLLHQSLETIEAATEERKLTTAEKATIKYSMLSHKETFLYYLLVTLTKGTLGFSAFSNYNSAVSFLIGIIAPIVQCYSDEEMLEYIHEHPALRDFVQSFAFSCAAAQALSFSTFQCQKIHEYILTWWFDSEERNKHKQLLGKWNSVIISNSIILIIAAMFFSIFSTEAGLTNFNDYFLKQYNIKISEDLFDMLTAASAFFAGLYSAITTLPSIYKFLEKHVTDPRISNQAPSVDIDNTEKVLPALGIGISLLGLVDAFFSTGTIVYSSIKKLSKMFNFSPYNPYAIGIATFTMGPANIIYNYSLNTLGKLEQLYVTRPRRSMSQSNTTLPSDTLPNSLTEPLIPARSLSNCSSTFFATPPDSSRRQSSNKVHIYETPSLQV